MIRPIRKSFRKVRQYVSKCYLPAHVQVCENLLANFYFMYGEGVHFTMLCNELQMQRVLIESMAGFAGDIDFEKVVIE